MKNEDAKTIQARITREAAAQYAWSDRTYGTLTEVAQLDRLITCEVMRFAQDDSYAMQKYARNLNT